MQGQGKSGCHHSGEQRSGAQIVLAAADRAPEAEVPLQPAMMQQIDGTVSSSPSRSLNSPQMYDEYDNDNYSEGIQDRGGRPPPIRPLGKADKPPVWKGSSVECWQEYTVSLHMHTRVAFRQQGRHDRSTGYPQSISNIQKGRGNSSS